MSIEKIWETGFMYTEKGEVPAICGYGIDIILSDGHRETFEGEDPIAVRSQALDYIIHIYNDVNRKTTGS